MTTDPTPETPGAAPLTDDTIVPVGETKHHSMRAGMVLHVCIDGRAACGAGKLVEVRDGRPGDDAFDEWVCRRPSCQRAWWAPSTVALRTRLAEVEGERDEALAKLEAEALAHGRTLAQVEAARRRAEELEQELGDLRWFAAEPEPGVDRMEHLGERYFAHYHGRKVEGFHLIDTAIEAVESEFANALRAGDYERYDCDGGLDEAIPFDVTAILVAGEVLDDYDHARTDEKWKKEAEAARREAAEAQATLTALRENMGIAHDRSGRAALNTLITEATRPYQKRLSLIAGELDPPDYWHNEGAGTADHVHDIEASDDEVRADLEWFRTSADANGAMGQDIAWTQALGEDAAQKLLAPEDGKRLITEVANARAQQLAEQAAVLEAHDDAIREALDFIHDDPGERPGKAARILNRVLEKHAGDTPGADALAAHVERETAELRECFDANVRELHRADGVIGELRAERDALAADNARLREALTIAVPCPHCLVSEGRPCRTEVGADVPHSGRVERAKQRSAALDATAENTAAWLAERDARVRGEACEALRLNVMNAAKELCAYADDTVWVGPAETLVDRLCLIADIEQGEDGEPTRLRTRATTDVAAEGAETSDSAPKA